MVLCVHLYVILTSQTAFNDDCTPAFPSEHYTLSQHRHPCSNSSGWYTPPEVAPKVTGHAHTCAPSKKQLPGWCLEKHQPTLLWTVSKFHPPTSHLQVTSSSGCLVSASLPGTKWLVSALSVSLVTKELEQIFQILWVTFFHKYLVLVISAFYFFLSRLLFSCKNFLCIPDISILSVLHIKNNVSHSISFLLTLSGIHVINQKSTVPV